MKKQLTIVTILKNPLFILLISCLSVLLGIMKPNIAIKLKPYGDLYLEALHILIIPIIITVIVSTISPLVKNHQLNNISIKIVLSFIVSLFASACIGTIAAIISNPGSGISYTYNSINLTKLGLWKSLPNILDKFITNNISNSIINMNYLEIIVASIILAIALGYIKRKQQDIIVNIMDGFYLAFRKISQWIIIFFPIGVIPILAFYSTNIILIKLNTIYRYLIPFYSIGLLSIIICIIIVWYKSRQKLIVVVSHITKLILLSFTTQLTSISIPYSLNSIVHELKFDKNIPNIFIPLSYVLGRFGHIVFFAFTSIFSLQVFGIEYSVIKIITIIIFSIIAGLFSVGKSSLVSISFISIILGALNIAPDSIFIVISASAILIYPIVEVLTVTLSLIVVSIISTIQIKVEEEMHPSVILQNLPDNINLKNYFSSYEGEIALLNQDKTPFLYTVFPNATFKDYKKWESIEIHWGHLDIEVVVGDKDKLKSISKSQSNDCKFVILNKKY